MFLIASIGFMRDGNFGVNEAKYSRARLCMAFLSLISFLLSILFQRLYTTGHDILGNIKGHFLNKLYLYLAYPSKSLLPI